MPFEWIPGLQDVRNYEVCEMEPDNSEKGSKSGLRTPLQKRAYDNSECDPETR